MESILEAGRTLKILREEVDHIRNGSELGWPGLDLSWSCR
jgi:hypothetical protein